MRDALPSPPKPRRGVQGAPLPGRGVPARVAAMALAGVAVILAARAVLEGAAPGVAAAICAHLLICGLALAAMRRTHPHARMGAGNAVTLARGALICALLMPLASAQPKGWAVAGVAGLALLMDGLDGWLARRGGTVSAFGARFDIEMDALLALVLSLHLIVASGAGPAVLVLGLIRYGFVLAGWLWPWLRADLPERRWRKLVCVLQIGVLILLQTPMPGPAAGTLLATGAAAALIASFAVDTRWLWARRP